MRKALPLLLAVLMASSVLGASAVISTDTPTIVLNSSNNYQVEKQFSGAGSSPDSVTYTWTWQEADTSKSGSSPTANFTFGLDDFKSNTIELLVQSANDTDRTTVNQVVRDVPRINTAKVSTDKVNLSNSDGKVDFQVNAEDTFNNNLSYEWRSDGSKVKTGQNVTYTFSSTGTYTISIKVTDASGLSKTKQAGTVEVVKASEDSGDDNNNPSPSPSPSPSSTPPSLPAENHTENNQTNKKPEDVPKGPKKARAEMSNGVATVTIHKENGMRDISISVAPRSKKATVKNIRISSNTTGEVKVSVKDLGRERPEKLPEAAAEQAIHNYQEINTTINDTEIEAAQIDFTVNQSWIEERNASRDNIVMKRFNNGNWSSLETQYINSTDNQLNFRASSEGFSYYAVALDEEKTQEGSEIPGTESSGNRDMVYILLSFLAVIALIAYLKREALQQLLN